MGYCGNCGGTGWRKCPHVGQNGPHGYVVFVNGKSVHKTCTGPTRCGTCRGGGKK